MFEGSRESWYEEPLGGNAVPTKPRSSTLNAHDRGDVGSNPTRRFAPTSVAYPDWKAAEDKFKCPYHGRGYDGKGISFEEPAPRPMDRAARLLRCWNFPHEALRLYAERFVPDAELERTTYARLQVSKQRGTGNLRDLSVPWYTFMNCWQ